MFKKTLSTLLATTLVAGSLSICSVSAAENNETSADAAQIETITPRVKNNIVTYYDQDGNKVDITKPNTHKKTRTALPSSYDLRDYGRSTSVKDQSNYGLCWDFASTASMESSILTKGLGNETSDTLDLSEGGNTWYLHTIIDDISSPLYDDYIDDPSKGADGGYADLVADSLSSGYGAYPESLMNYSSFKSGYPEALRYYSDYRLKDFNTFEYDIDLIKQKIMDNGAVYYTYNCYSANSYYTKDGMEAYYDNGTPIQSSEKDSGHAVTIIGWDDNFSKDNFNPEMRPKNDGAWLCKNSWGESYQQTPAEGYEGYFWVSYENFTYDVSQFEMQSCDSFDNIYQHQITAFNYTKVNSAANIFTAKSTEKLQQVCFSNLGEADVVIKAYKLNKNHTSPVDGELLTSFTKHIDYAGTHCIDFPNEIILNESEEFSVVIESKDSFVKFKSEHYANLDNAGKSYFSLSDNDWIDVADEIADDVSYAAIKVYTSNVTVDKSELSKLTEEIKSFVPSENISKSEIDEFNALTEKAKKLIADEKATQNTINNTYCILKEKYDFIQNYCYYINSIGDFYTYYNAVCNNTMKAKYIELNVDLDFGNHIFDTPLYGYDSFTGTFDGNGHTIKNYTLKEKTNFYAYSNGFFSNLKNATIKDVIFDNAFVYGNATASIIAGSAVNSQFINCTVKNSKAQAFDGMCVALITSNAFDSTFTNCKIENSSATGGYYCALFAFELELTNKFVNCTATNYTVISKAYISDNQGFEVADTSGSLGSFAIIKVTDDSCIIEECLGKIESVENNGVELTNTDGVYYIDKANGPAYLNITFSDLEYDSECMGTVNPLTKEFIITGYNGTESDITIPEAICGFPVTALSDAFINLNSTEIESISIPKSIKTISDGVFSNFDSLKSITIADGVETIGSDAFRNCPQLSNINLPDSIRSIGDNAFSGCSAKSITLGKNIEEIGEYAFGYTKNYTPIDGFVVKGYAGTASEEYAKSNGFTFVDLTK